MSKSKTAATGRPKIAGGAPVPDWIQDPGDPLGIARGAPAWFRNHEVGKLPLTVRLRNVFTNNQINVVSDLDRYSDEDFSALKNIGVTSRRHLAEALLESLQAGLEARGGAPDLVSGGGAKDGTRGGRKETNNLSGAVSRGLMGNLLGALDKVGEREREIVLSRMGYGETSKTLGGLGVEYGVTRERIRQIEQRVIDPIRLGEACGDLMRSRLNTVLRKRDTPLPLSDLERADDWFRGVSEHPDMAEYLVEKLCPKAFNVISVADVKYISRLDQNIWDETVRDGRNLLRNSVGLILPEDECRRQVASLLPATARELEPLLWTEASRYCHFSGLRNPRVLTSYGRGREHLVRVILEDSPEPVHAREVSRKLAETLGREFGFSRVQAALSASGVLLGKGTFGTREHIPLSDAALKKAAEIASKAVNKRGARGRQWHAQELLREIRGKDPGLHDKFDKYRLNAALRWHSDLKYLGRFMWTGPEGNGSRVHIKEALREILRDAGEPLATSELKSRVAELRGMGKTFQIGNRDPVLRVGRGMWGLNDRDFAVKRDRQPELVEAVIDALRRKESGIAVEEADRYIDFSPRMNGDSIFSIATTDDRLTTGIGRVLFLREWGGPRI